MSVWQTIRVWGEMIKFSHSIFALPFALMATLLAGRSMPGGLPAWGQIGLMVVCMVGARSFAMTFNRIADATIDARNPRTAVRPLPAGIIRRADARFFLVIAAIVFAGGCTGFRVVYANSWPLILALPTLTALAAYSYCKRFTPLAHFVLGGVIGFAPVAAWIAIHPASLGWPTIVLATAVCLWISGFDLIYACQDVGVDRRDGLYSIPSRLGVVMALRLSRLCHFLTVVLLFTLGKIAGLGWIYFSGCIVTTIMLIAEQSIVSPGDLSRVNLAFFTINGFVSLLLGASGIVDVLLHRTR